MGDTGSVNAVLPAQPTVDVDRRSWLCHVALGAGMLDVAVASVFL